MTRPNARMERLGDELRHVVAPLVSNAVEHIAFELTLADSFPDHTPGAGEPVALPYLERPPCRSCKGTGWFANNGMPTRCDNCDANGKAKLTPVERAAQERYMLTARREDIRDLLQSIEELVGSLRHECDQALRTRVADPRTVKEKPTCHADAGLAGYLVPLSEGGWMDPSCQRISRTFKPGLCDACNMRQARYRERHDLKPTQDDRVVTHDSEVHYVEGAAIVRSVA